MLGKWLHKGGTISESEGAEFRSMAQRMVTDGIIVFGEFGLHHFGIPRMGNQYGQIPLDHPLLKVLGDVSASSGVPIDVHFDVVPRDGRIPSPLEGAGNPNFLEANLSQFEKFLTDNRGAKIVWAHAGFEPSPFRSAELNANLLRRHSNLYMSIRLMRGAPKPSAAMDGSGRLKSEWRQLFVEFSDRFVLGSESMYGSSMSGMFDTEFMLFQRLLGELPPTVARKIASENARRIYPLDRNR
jgi:predicted TIM-barrel fold metal-dependent hydrolase